MKAAFFDGPGRIVVRDTPDPVCPPGGLLTKVEACSICGTDIRSWRFGSKREGEIIGHETVATVVEVGGGVEGFRVGDRVEDCPVSCGKCQYCSRGRDNLCPSRGNVGGVPQGGFAELRPILASAVQGDFVLKIPPDLSPQAATLVEPLACVINGNEKLEVGFDSTVAVIGAGPIGIMHLILAKMRGASRVFLIDLNRDRLELAQPFGPDFCINASEEDPVHAVREMTRGVGVDVAIVACVSQTAQAQAVEMASRGGQVLMFAGLPEDAPLATINMNLVHYNELRLIGAKSSVKRQWDLALGLIASGKVDADRIVNCTVTLRDINKGFEMAASGKVLKVAVKP